jgi:hypothetical protein
VEADPELERRLYRALKVLRRWLLLYTDAMLYQLEREIDQKERELKKRFTPKRPMKLSKEEREMLR